uniref:Uncharacterized protein n=1 Tax=Inkyuleea mariana TaxID=123988 RepID=A0A4D6WZR3_9FLOR|nr:hypothetical protein [Inkyuleea mariana]
MSFSIFTIYITLIIFVNDKIICNMTLLFFTVKYNYKSNSL